MQLTVDSGLAILRPIRWHLATSLTVLGLTLTSGVILPGQPLTAHEMPGMSTSGGAEAEAHAHKTLEIPAGQPVPTVILVAFPDAIQGWNLEVKVSNFRFAPEHVNGKSLTTEGHAHLYVDGKKVTRLYGNWYYLPSLPPGQHTITVSLNANGHEQLTHQGKPLQASIVVKVPAAR
jgi:hypothetical protein